VNDSIVCHCQSMYGFEGYTRVKHVMSYLGGQRGGT
jgi:hypothetical protein